MFDFEQTVDLQRDNPVAIREQPIVKGDGSVLRWRVRVSRGGKPLDLNGATAVLYCARAIVPDTGEGGGTTRSDAVCQDGGVIEAELPQDAANIPGAVGCTLCVVLDGKRTTVARMAVEAIDPIGSDIVDVGKRIPSIDEVIAAMARCESAAQAAEDAAAAANAAADAASKAAQQAAPWSGAQATALSLPAGSAPTVAVTTGADGTRRLMFGIPKGDKGDKGSTGATGATGPQGEKGDTGQTGLTPQLTIKVLTGAPGTQASVVQSGTADNPVITLTIPRGDTGEISKLTVCGVSPDASGAVALGVSLAVDGSGNGTLAIGGGNA